MNHAISSGSGAASWLPCSRMLLLVSATLLYFFANIQRVAIPGAIFDLLQADLHLSAPRVTALGSSFMYVYALNQLTIGVLINRYGGRRVITAGGLLFCIGSLLFPWSSTPFELYFSRGLTGLGASAIYLSLIDEIIRSFPGNYTIAISLAIMTGYAGGIMANAPFVAGVHLLGWQTLLKLIAALSIGCYLCFLVAGMGGGKRGPGRRISGVSTTFKGVLALRHNRELFLFSGINFGLYYVLQTVIGKKFLEDFCRFEPEPAAWILSLMGALSALSCVLFALLSRLTGNRRRIFCRAAGVVCFTVFTLVTLCLAFDLGCAGMIAGLFCLLALTASTSSITIPLLHETNPPELAGTAVSFMNFSFYLAVAIFGNAVGFLLNLYPPEQSGGIRIYSRDSYLAVFLMFALCSCVVLKYSLRMRETMGRPFGGDAPKRHDRS